MSLIVLPQPSPTRFGDELLERHRRLPLAGPLTVEVGEVRQRAVDRLTNDGAEGAARGQQLDRFERQVAGDEDRLGEQGTREGTPGGRGTDH